MRGIIFDMPHCAEGARQNLAAAGVAERAEAVLSEVVHETTQ